MKTSIFNIFIVLIVLIYSNLSGQVTKIEFAQGEEYSNVQIIKISETSLLALYTIPNTNEFHYLYCRKSDNGGVNWGAASFLDTVYFVAQSDSVPEFIGIKLNSGKVLVFYKGINSGIDIRSTDNLIDWSEKIKLPISGNFIAKRNNGFHSVCQAPDNTLYFGHSVRGKGLYIYKSTNEGTNWTIFKEVTQGSKGDPSLLTIGNKIMIFYSDLDSQSKRILGVMTSDDNGINWSDKYIQIPISDDIYNPNAVINPNGSISLYFEVIKPTSFSNYKNNEIYFAVSTDNCTNWEQISRVTHFPGYDGRYKVYQFNRKTILTFFSERNDPLKNKRAFTCEGKADVDNNSCPFVFNFISKMPSEALPQLILNAFVDAANGIRKASVIYEVNNTKDSIDLYDDSNHYDSLANDKIFGNITQNLLIGKEYVFKVSVISNNDEYACYNADTIPFFPNTYEGSMNFHINNLNMNISKKGEINGAWFDGKLVLMRGGFFLSGYSDNYLWNSSIAPGFLIEDYIPGNVFSSLNDYRNRIYTVKSNDPAFSNSWISWKSAVELGARYYDGDNNGVYDPIDINGNGTWEPNEDRPDLIGDLTAFCVYNDGRLSINRLINSEPQKIEVRQTVFASHSGLEEALNNTVFVRYSIVNKNPVVPRFNEVIFSTYTDIDIGDHTDDYAGVDTIHQSIFGYNKTPDYIFGEATPALYAKIVQGPYSYIKDATYQDINQNGIYDRGIDIPLDTAYNKFGSVLGQQIFPGAVNQRINSSIIFVKSDSAISEPYTINNVRNSQLGLTKQGYVINPCNFQYGQVLGGVNCNLINKRFVFSGDPISQVGWFCNTRFDPRQIVSTGIFQLEYNKPVDIIVAYLVGKGNSPLNSISVARNYSDSIQASYESNFVNILPEIKEVEISEISDYALFNNYPNPFNPSTTISYQIPVQGLVSLKVYDILGREVADLVNETQPAGKYKVSMNAAKLSSGVYFYRLTANSFVSTKKMILLK